MPTTVTEADVYEPTVEVPNDGESANQSSLLTRFVQDLVNRTNFLSKRGAAALYSMSGTSVASLAKVTLTNVINDTGYSLASNEVTVPRAGVYFVEIHASLASAGTGNPQAMILEAQTVAGTACDAYGYRYSATTSDKVAVAASGLVSITDPATEKIKVVNAHASAVTLSDDPRLSIVRVR